MKNIVRSMVLIGILFSCRDEDAVRIPDFLEAPNFRMQLRPANSYFDFENINNAKLIYDLYSISYNEIETVDVRFRYLKNGNVPCNQGGCAGPFVLKTYTSAELRAANGILEGEEITIQDVIALVGITESDITGGDQFFFEMITSMKDGRVYPSETVNGQDNVPGIFDQPGANYTSSFAAIVGCPVAAPFTGTYKLEQVEGDYNWNGGTVDDPIFPTQNVSISAVNPITRTTSATNGYLGFNLSGIRFILLCENVVLPTSSSGLSCSGVNITWSTADPVFTNVGGVLATYDPTDDSEIILEFADNAGSACGGVPVKTILKLTKQ